LRVLSEQLVRRATKFSDYKKNAISNVTAVMATYSLKRIIINDRHVINCQKLMTPF